MIAAVVGLQREARLLEAPGFVTVIGGGDSAGLKAKLDSLLARGEIKGILSIGIAGGLAPDLHPGSLILATEVVCGPDTYPTDPDWLQKLWRKLPRARPGAIAGSDTLIHHRPDKTSLFETTGALAVDMESHIAARAALGANLPFAALRVVCDPADRTLPHAARVAMKPDGGIDLGAIARSILSRPQQIPDLIYAARDSSAAFKALLRCRDLLGDRFFGPDLH